MGIKYATQNIIGGYYSGHQLCRVYYGQHKVSDFCGGSEDEYPPYSILYSTNGNTTSSKFKINGNDTDIIPQPNKTDELVTFDVGTGLTSLRQFCYSIHNITSLKFVGKWDTSKVTDFYYFVSFNTYLETLEGIENFVVSSATEMSNCLYYNRNLKEIDISGWVFNENIEYYKTPAIQADKIYCSCDFKNALFTKTVVENKYNNNTSFQNMITKPEYCRLPETENGIFYKANSTSNSNYFKINNTNTTERPSSTDGKYVIFGKQNFNDNIYGGLYQFANNIKNLTYIEFLPSWKTENVTSAYYMFYGCSALEEIKGLENIDWTNVTIATYMFNNCENLREIDISPLRSCNEITSTSSMFSSCKELTDIDISGINFSEDCTMSYMFSICQKLETVNLGELTPSSRLLTNMFSNCGALKKIICTCEMKRYIEVMYSSIGLTSEQMQNIEFETIDGDDCPEYVPNNSIRYSTDNTTSSEGFYWNDASSSTMKPSSNKTDEMYIFPQTPPTSMKKFMYFATNVTKLEFIGDWDTSNVTNMQNAFYYNSKITELDLSKFNTRKVTNMGTMFQLQNLERLILGEDFSTESVTYYSDMFYSTTNLKYIKCSCDFYKWCEEHKSEIGLADIWDNIEWDTDCEITYPPYTVRYTTTDDDVSTYLRINGDVVYVERGTDMIHTFDIDTLTSLRDFCWNNNNFEKIEFLGEWDCTNLTNVRAMFPGNYNLKEIKGLNKLDVSRSISYRETFKNIACEELDIRDWVLNNNLDEMENLSNHTGDAYCFILSNEIKRLYADKIYFPYATYQYGNQVPNAEYVRTNCRMAHNLIDGAPSGYYEDTYFDIVDECDITPKYPPYSILYSTDDTEANNLFNFNHQFSKEDDIEIWGKYVPQPNKTDELMTFTSNSPLTTLYYFVGGKENLTSIKFVGEWDTTDVESMSYMFCRLDKLTNIEGLEKFDTQNVTDIGDMFLFFKSGIDIDLSWFNFGKFIAMNSMFYGATIGTLDLSSLHETTSLTTTTEMFYGAHIKKIRCEQWFKDYCYSKCTDESAKNQFFTYIDEVEWEIVS